MHTEGWVLRMPTEGCVLRMPTEGWVLRVVVGVIGVVEARVIDVAGVVRSQDVERSGRGSWQEDEREIGGREGSGRSTSWLMDYTSFKGLNNCFVLQFVG